MYGGWRRRRSVGFAGLDGRQSILLVMSLVVPLFAALVLGWALALWLVPFAVLTAIGAVVSVRGVWVVDLALALARYSLGRARGQSQYRAQLWAPWPRRGDLPGVLAPTHLLQADEAGRGPVGVVWNKQSGRMSATYLLSPGGALLADQEQVSARVAGWGETLAALADDTAITHASVTIDLQPEVGTQLTDHVQARTAPTAPPLARQVVQEVVAAAPVTTTRIRARMTLTINPMATRARDIPGGVAETLRSLGGLSLTAAGVDVLRRASADDLVRIVRTAFDPAAEQVIDPDAWAQTDWADAGPVSAQEEVSYYAHDGMYSATWCLVEAPRQQVRHDVLMPLLAPGYFPRRVSILYRTLSRGEAGRLLAREKDAANARTYYQQKTGRDPSARDDADAARAHQAAYEEAQGAGLVEFSIFVTTTVRTLEQLVEASREVEQAASQSRLRLRPCWGGQAAAFATGLGVAGLYPPEV
ncbi:SCO6880 family protein [Nocardiopsis dassonvillei]|uniref:SCO6880 family protein n=1 Tax=Nocardiopsis dassonvillei TaxID=2014 RepID=UPI0033C4F49C